MTGPAQAGCRAARTSAAPQCPVAEMGKEDGKRTEARSATAGTSADGRYLSVQSALALHAGRTPLHTAARHPIYARHPVVPMSSGPPCGTLAHIASPKATILPPVPSCFAPESKRPPSEVNRVRPTLTNICGDEAVPLALHESVRLFVPRELRSAHLAVPCVVVGFAVILHEGETPIGPPYTCTERGPPGRASECCTTGPSGTTAPGGTKHGTRHRGGPVEHVGPLSTRDERRVPGARGQVDVSVESSVSTGATRSAPSSHCEASVAAVSSVGSRRERAHPQARGRVHRVRERVMVRQQPIAELECGPHKGVVRLGRAMGSAAWPS